MTVEQLIATYGYLAVVVGTFFEGETVLVVAGFAAHRGYMHFRYVLLAAFLGSLAGDQLYFFLGRKHGAALLARRPRWQVHADRVHYLLERHPALFILAFRFGLLYGFRTVAPFVIGMSRVPTSRFVLYNTIGAAVWALSVGALGYFFGHALELLLGDVKRYEREAFLLLVAVGAGLWLVRFLRNRRAKSARQRPA
jgi:membrane protein DedA with SNARE-associated domain